jgi:hypothetical protein
MKTPSQAIAEGQRLQSLSMIRNNPRHCPIGWTPELWRQMLQKLSDQAKESGVTNEELRAAGMPASSKVSKY